IEIQPGLLAIGNYIQSRGYLVMNGRYDGIFLQFGAVRLPELAQMRAGKFKPGGKGVAADDGRAERMIFHKLSGPSSGDVRAMLTTFRPRRKALPGDGHARHKQI